MGAQEIAAQAAYSVLISQSNETYETEVANANVMLENRVEGYKDALRKHKRPIISHFRVLFKTTHITHFG